MRQLELDEEPVPEDDRAADAEDLVKKPNDRCQSQQLGCDECPRAGHSWSLKTQTSKPETCPYFLYENKAEKNADKITITDDIQSKSGQS